MTLLILFCSVFHHQIKGWHHILSLIWFTDDCWTKLSLNCGNWRKDKKSEWRWNSHNEPTSGHLTTIMICFVSTVNQSKNHFDNSYSNWNNGFCSQKSCWIETRVMVRLEVLNIKRWQLLPHIIWSLTFEHRWQFIQYVFYSSFDYSAWYTKVFITIMSEFYTKSSIILSKGACKLQ